MRKLTITPMRDICVVKILYTQEKLEKDEFCRVLSFIQGIPENEVKKFAAFDSIKKDANDFG